jgi:hypothetical protein
LRQAIDDLLCHPVVVGRGYVCFESLAAVSALIEHYFEPKCGTETKIRNSLDAHSLFDDVISLFDQSISLFRQKNSLFSCVGNFTASL